MLIGDAVARSIDAVAARGRDVERIFAPQSAPAAPGDTYFTSMGEHGRLVFTRTSDFTLRDGELVDAQGRAVLGYRTPSAALGPLRADPIDAALGLTADARLEADGSVTYERPTIDPRTGRRELQRTAIGRVALARFAPGTKLETVDGVSARAPDGIVPHFGRPGDGNFATLPRTVRPRDVSDLDAGLQRLQDAYLALDAMRAATVAENGVEKSAMDLLK